MFAIAFDLVVADVQKHHPKGVTQAYVDIRSTLDKIADYKDTAKSCRTGRSDINKCTADVTEINAVS